jgi:hypothetical protein
MIVLGAERSGASTRKRFPDCSTISSTVVKVSSSTLNLFRDVDADGDPDMNQQ